MRLPRRRRRTAAGDPSPTAGMGVSTCTHESNGEGCCPPPCGPDTGQWNRDGPGAVLALPTEGKGREGGVRVGGTRRLSAEA